MEKDVLEKYKMNSRAEAVAFLKSLCLARYVMANWTFFIKKPRRITVIGNALVVGNAMMPSNC